MAPNNFLLQLILLHLYVLQVNSDRVDISLTPQDNSVGLSLPENSTDRTWNVTGPTGSQVYLNCAHLTILESSACAEGFLSTWDSARGLEKICNKSVSEYSRLSAGNQMIIQLKVGPRGVGQPDCTCTLRLRLASDEGGPVTAPGTVSGVQNPSRSDLSATRQYGELFDQDKEQTAPTNKRRIVGGHKTEENGYIQMAYLWSLSLSKVVCGGSVLTKRHVLSAAHCLDHLELPNDLRVVVGGHDVTTDSNSGKTQTLNVLQWYQHEDYSADKFLNDIAILLFTEDIRFTNYVGPTYLPSVQHQLVEKYVRAVGWGALKEGGRTSRFLRSVRLKVVPLEVCCDGFGPDCVRLRNPTQICVYTHGKDTCEGDSGGPFLYMIPRTDQYVQVAVINSGGTCGEDPSFAAEIWPFLGWIQGKLAEYTAETLTYRTY